MPEKHKEHEEHKEHKEHKEEHKEHKEQGIKISYTSVIVIAAIVALVVGIGIGILITPAAKTSGGTVITKDAAQQKAQAYIQSVVGSTSVVTVSNLTEVGDIYAFDVNLDNSVFKSYMTKDGTLLFPSAYDVTKAVTPPEPAKPTKIPKTDKPKVELFVMSFCPYGIQAEAAMKPVVDLFGTKVDFVVRFIVNTDGDTVDSVQSLHGANEAKEDLRQVCIAKYYDLKTYWSYIGAITTGYPSTISTSTIDTKWKEIANATNISISKIETCFNAESVSLIKIDEQIANDYGVSGSPTLIINGVDYSGQRTAEAYKQSVCSAFTTPPAECAGVTLNNTATTASGNC